ncbi:hypothetical protein [Aliarcobacter butzleri]|uniref:hypothetical protein n=1 Tax=Aliarcobacter butzleri TaxID=28197 RepID=UPI00126A4AD4|nr:hypothetical protein [Aliarcobacter butzleri]
MNIEDIVKDKIPLLDDVVYFVPPGINTLDDYKKEIQYQNAVSSQKTIDIKAEEEKFLPPVQFEEEIFIPDENIDTPPDMSDFVSTENFIPEEDDFSSNNSEDDKKTSSTHENDRLISCINLSMNDELEEIIVTNDEIETFEVKNSEHKENTNEEENSLSNVIGASIDIDVASIIYGNDTLKFVPEEIGFNNEEDKKYSVIEEKLDFVNKTNKLSKEDEDDISEMLAKINTIHDLNEIDEEDDLMGMLGKITLKDIEDDI